MRQVKLAWPELTLKAMVITTMVCKPYSNLSPAGGQSTCKITQVASCVKFGKSRECLHHKAMDAENREPLAIA